MKNFLPFIPLALFVLCGLLLGAYATHAQTVSSYTRIPSDFSFEPQDVTIDAVLTGLDTAQYARVVISGPGGVLPADTPCIDISTTTQAFNDNVFELDGSQFVGAYSLPRIFFFSNSTCTTHAGTVSLNPYLGNAVSAPVEFVVSAPYPPDSSGTTVTVEDSLFTTIFFAVVIWLLIFFSVFYLTKRFAS